MAEAVDGSDRSPSAGRTAAAGRAARKSSVASAMGEPAPSALTLLEYEHIAAARIEHLVPVTQPFALITQAPRSGGSLLMRLFDGHSSCHTIPHEGGIGFFDLADLGTTSEDAWNALNRYTKLAGKFEEGYRQRKMTGDESRYPFVLPPGLHHQLFQHVYASLGERTSRTVSDAYLTAYFNAWLDNRSLRTGEKAWVVGFTPRLLTSLTKRRCFDEMYPDGFMISIVREPASWWASARRWDKEWSDRDKALEQWTTSTLTALKRKRSRPENTLLLCFDDLILNTRGTMTLVARRLGIPFEPTMTEPTFNGSPVKANSSFPWGDATVSSAPTKRAQDGLTAEDRAAIADAAGPLYEQALRQCARPAAAKKRDTTRPAAG